MYQRNFRQNRKKLRKIDKFNTLISDERKIINDVNRKNNNSIRLLNEFQVNRVYMVDDIIKTIVDYITRKKNNNCLKMMKMNEIEQEIKYNNHSMIALKFERSNDS